MNGAKLVSLGYVRPAHSDNDIASLGLAGGLQQLKDDFDVHYEEAQRHPMKFGYAMHNLTNGPRDWLRSFDNFSTIRQGFPDVWFGRCIDMANWLEQESSFEQSGRGSHKAA